MYISKENLNDNSIKHFHYINKYQLGFFQMIKNILVFVTLKANCIATFLCLSVLLHLETLLLCEIFPIMFHGC